MTVKAIESGSGRPFFPTGCRLRFPSGQTGVFKRWRTRAVKSGDAKAGLEIIAVVRLDGADMDTEFGDRFMSRVLICQ
jgi:hypothetical protein